MFQFHDLRVPLTLNTSPIGRAFAECDTHVALNFTAEPVVTRWGIDDWRLALAPEVVEFFVAPLDLVTQEALPSLRIRVPLAAVPCRWVEPGGLSSHQLMCRELCLSFADDGKFEPEKSWATFSS